MDSVADLLQVYSVYYNNNKKEAEMLISLYFFPENFPLHLSTSTVMYNKDICVRYYFVSV